MAREKCRTCSYKCEKCEQEPDNWSHNKTDSLCWCCKRAVPDEDIEECDWCRHGIPIYGWDAKRHKDANGNVGFKVITCPLFIKG